MNRKNITILLIIVLFLSGFFLLNNNKKGNKESGISEEGNLIYEETVSPNGDYVSSEEDKVFFTVKVYNNDKTIAVKSSSNTSFAKELSYEIKYDGEISKDDIKIEWTTLMGDTDYTQDDQIGIAVVTLSHNNEVFSQRKISFVSNAIDIVVDTINK